ncbi:hypothetical protein LC55x_1125 [Lysobacter capsici]|nr:hypothetical protein LC55x_1125 [Lysobacter capsici]
MADLEATIASSPYLSNVMSSAIESGSLKHLATTNEPHQSGHYDNLTGTIHLNTSNFDPKNYDNASDRRDSLAVVLGHETGHALLADAAQRERYTLSYNITEGIRTASREQTSVDVTEPADRYLTFMRRNEAMAELVGMNALASRVNGGAGEFDRAEFLRRADPSTPCVEKGKLAPGIHLSPEGIQAIGSQFQKSPAIEAVAQCFTDPTSSIGQHGKSSYRDTHGAFVMSTVASEFNDYAKDTTMHVPDVEMNLATLKLDPRRVERAGLDLGGAGQSFSYVDTSRGLHERETVSHTKAQDLTGAVHRAGAFASTPPSDAAAFRADSSGHPDHRAFEMFHRAAQTDGRWSEAELRNIAAAGLAAVKADPVVGHNLTGVVMGRATDGGASVIGYSSPHGPAGPHHHLGVDASSAAQTPATQSLDRVEQLNDQRQVQQQAQAQQLEQQAAHGQAGPKMGMSL